MCPHFWLSIQIVQIPIVNVQSVMITCIVIDIAILLINYFLFLKTLLFLEGLVNNLAEAFSTFVTDQFLVKGDELGKLLLAEVAEEFSLGHAIGDW
jgi:hypothetical protein